MVAEVLIDLVPLNRIGLAYKTLDNNPIALVTREEQLEVP